MVFPDSVKTYFASIPFNVRAALAQRNSLVPFLYDQEPFFPAYDALFRRRARRQSQRLVASELSLGRDRLQQLERAFLQHGTLGLLHDIPFLDVDPRLEQLVVLIKSARPHQHAALALRLSNALEIPGASLELIRLIQRCHGFGHNMDPADLEYFSELQHILDSVNRLKNKPSKRNQDFGKKHFFDFEHDSFQRRVELFKALAACNKPRQLRPILRQFGVHPNRFYEFRRRFLAFGIWGLVDRVQTTKHGELLSPETELLIIEERLMNPSLSTSKLISTFELKCSRSLVQKVFQRWGLARFSQPIALRGVIAHPVPEASDTSPLSPAANPSARARFPDLIVKANLKVNSSFARLLGTLSRRSVVVSNPGAILAAPFLDQLGVVEALHTYGPGSLRASEITNNLIVNTLRIIAGFPTIHAFTQNSDRSVAIGAGLSLAPSRSKFYDSFDSLRFEHLHKLRNDLAIRARELGVVEAAALAMDYHCDPSDSRFPYDKSFSKAPDKNGDMVYAHRPHIIWDSLKNTIVNIAYCEGRSRAPSALYKFCEENLFKIIEPAVLRELYADSEYTGEKQLVYLVLRTGADITMCLKQNPKIKRWRDETIRVGNWEKYGSEYRIASRDFTLAETGKPFRFIVKEHLQTHEVRCFGSTHLDQSPTTILDAYHIRWPVETGIKDLIENYFLNHPTGTSPEKVEAHYYCVMMARLTVDYFRSVVCCPKWRKPEDWECVLSTIRSTLFTSQNCVLSQHESGDLLLTYLDGDPQHIKAHVAKVLQDRQEAGLNQVSWWGNRGLRIAVKDQYALS